MVKSSMITFMLNGQTKLIYNFGNLTQMKNSAKVRFNKSIQGSRDSDNYATPIKFYNKLNEEFAFTFDPTPFKHDFSWDGLIVKWKGNIYCNPPYSNIEPFIKKAINEIEIGNCQKAVFLLPVRSDTKYWHNLIMEKASEIRFVKGRLNFNESKSPAPFPCVIIVFENNREILKVKTHLS